MYLNPNEAMQILGITTRQGLHKIVKNHGIRFKSQGAGFPNLYLAEDIEKYIYDNAHTHKKNPAIARKAEQKKSDIKKQKAKAERLKVKVKKEIANLPKPDKNKDPDFSGLKMEDLLNEVGKDEFNRVVKILQDNGTYKEQDRALVLTYAVSYQNWVFATIASGKEDNTTTDQFGVLKLHPYFTVAEKCAAQMTKNAAMIGIGVRSRIGLDIKQPKKESIFDILNKEEDF